MNHSSRGKTAAEQLTAHFDNNWSQTRSSLRDKAATHSSYNPLYSWEGRSDDPRSFTKLQVTHYPSALTKPLCMSGASIIPLERNEDVSIFNGFQADSALSSSIPRTLQQRDVEMASDLSGNIDYRKKAAASQSAVIATAKTRYQNMQLGSPRYEIKALPEHLVAAGPNADQTLLRPQDRRSLNEFEARRRDAAADMKVAVAQRMRTKAQVEGSPFYRGILSVDSSSNENSLVYGARAMAKKEILQQQRMREQARTAHLANSTSSLSSHGDILVPDSIAESVKVANGWQRKNGHQRPVLNTHSRIFEHHDATIDWLNRIPPKERTQKLRNEETSGKPYDIVNHAKISFYPPETDFRREEKRILAHPSQHSLESSRNMQGALQTIH